MRPALLLSLLLAPIAVAAQETGSDTLLTVEHYLDWEQVSDAQISPDGVQIVYTRRWVNKLEDKWESALWIMSADGSHQRFLAKGSNARWSPDGTRIAFLADGEPKGTQLFVRWMDAEGAVTQITRVEETPADPRWAPDGKAISFAMLVPDSTVWKISLPQPPQGAKWTPAPRVVDELHYRQDRVGFMKQGFTNLFLVPAEGGTQRQLTSGHWNVGARFDGGRQDARLRRAARHDVGRPVPGLPHLRARRGERGDPHARVASRLLGRPDRVTRRPDGGVHGIRFQRAYPSDLRFVRDRHRRLRDARSVEEPRPGSRRSHVGAGRQGDLLHRPRPRLDQRSCDGPRGWGTRRDPGRAGGLALVRGAHSHGGRGWERPGPSRGRGTARPAQARFPGAQPAHERERGRAGEQAIGADGGDLVHLDRRDEGAGMGRQAAVARSREAVSVDPRDPRRPVRDVQRGVQLHVPELRGEWLRRAVRQPARQHRLWGRILQRHRPQLSRPRFRRPHGGRGCRDRARSRRLDADVRVRLLGWRGALELGDRPHDALRRCRGALSRDRLDRDGRRDRHSAVHLQLLPPAVLGKSRRVAGAFVAHVRGPRDDADAAYDGGAGPPHPDSADRGVLRGAQDAACPGSHAAIQ